MGPHGTYMYMLHGDSSHRDGNTARIYVAYAVPYVLTVCFLSVYYPFGVLTYPETMLYIPWWSQSSLSTTSSLPHAGACALPPSNTGGHSMDDLIDVHALMQKLGVGRRWVWERMHDADPESRLPYVRLGRRTLRFRVSDVEKWISRQRHNVGAGV